MTKKSRQSRLEKVKKDIFSLNPRKLEEIAFYLLIFFLPTQLAYHFWPDWAFIFGIRIDYLSPTIYLTDLIVLVLLLFSIYRKMRPPKYLFWILVFALLNIGVSISPLASLTKWIKIFELYFLAYYVFNNKKLLEGKKFINVLSASLIMISVVAIAQFFLGKTIGSLFYLLGERTFDITTPGIALQNIGSREFLRPYSTFAHPNSLAGFMILMMMLFPGVNKILPAVTVILTGSLSSFIGFFSSIFLRYIAKFVFMVIVVSSLLLPFIKLNGVESLSERLELAEIAKDVIGNNFWFGSGLNTFVYHNSLLQPVHNLFLLVFSETGIFGFLFFVILFFKGIRKSALVFLFVLITGFFDHYWLTLQQNMLLLALTYGYLL